MPSLEGDYHAFRTETGRLNELIRSTSEMSPAHRKFIAEIALLRLAILIENSMKVVFCKLSCGAAFLDASAPTLLSPQANKPRAIAAMKTLGRPKQRLNLPWNDGSEIRDNIRFIIAPSDPCHGELIKYAAYLSEIRWLRNHIAHRNDGTRSNFRKLVTRYYGANVPGVTCGNLLVSPRVSPIRPLLITHIQHANIMMKDILRA